MFRIFRKRENYMRWIINADVGSTEFRYFCAASGVFWWADPWGFDCSTGFQPLNFHAQAKSRERRSLYHSEIRMTRVSLSWSDWSDWSDWSAQPWSIKHKLYRGPSMYSKWMIAFLMSSMVRNACVAPLPDQGPFVCIQGTIPAYS